MGFLSNLFGGLGKAVSGAGSSLFKGAQNLMNPIQGAVSAGMKAGKGLMSGAGGGSNPLSSIMNMFGGGGSTGATKTPATSPMQATGYGQLSKQALQNSPYQMNAMPFSSPSGGGVGNNSAPTNDKKKNPFSSIMDQLFPGGTASGIAGMALPMIGDMFAPDTKEMPDFNSLSSVQSLQNFRPGNSISPEYRTMLQHETDRMKDQKVKNLQNLYHNARPGTDYLTDSNYQSDLAKLNMETETTMADNLARAEGQFSAEEQQKLSELAQLDISSIAYQTGLSYQEADNFKQMFSDIGNTFMTNATRKPGTDLMSLFGGQ